MYSMAQYPDQLPNIQQCRVTNPFRLPIVDFVMICHVLTTLLGVFSSPAAKCIVVTFAVLGFQSAFGLAPFSNNISKISTLFCAHADIAGVTVFVESYSLISNFVWVFFAKYKQQMQ